MKVDALNIISCRGADGNFCGTADLGHSCTWSG